MDYIKKYQNKERLYLPFEYMGNNLMSARDTQLLTLVSLYLEIKKRKENNILKETEEEKERIFKYKKLINKIKIHQKYLNDENLFNIKKKKKNKEEKKKKKQKK